MTQQNNETSPEEITTTKDVNTINDKMEIPTKLPTKTPTFLKIFLVITLIISATILYKNFQLENATYSAKYPNKHLGHPNKPETVQEGDVIDINDDYKTDTETALRDLNISEIKEKGAEFIYQLLIKNQSQIEDLSNQIQSFKLDFVKLKNQTKFYKLILNYTEIREKLFNGEDCQTAIETYDLLTINDDFLQKKFTIIKENYHKLSTQKKLIDDFKTITKQLIINENYDESQADFLEKMRHNLKKLVIIRKTSNVAPNQLEGIIIDIEKALAQKNYQEALTRALTLDKIYSPIIQKFLEDLNIAIEIQNADQEIIKYLKSLT